MLCGKGVKYNRRKEKTEYMCREVRRGLSYCPFRGEGEDPTTDSLDDVMLEMRALQSRGEPSSPQGDEGVEEFGLGELGLLLKREVGVEPEVHMVLPCRGSLLGVKGQGEGNVSSSWSESPSDEGSLWSPP